MDAPDITQDLLDAATLAMRIRCTYARLGYSHKERYWTYVVLLQNNTVYVGSTNNPYQRLLDHELQSESSSVWVRQHGPVVRILELVQGSGPGDEKYKYLEYCSMYGWQNVRGHAYCRSVQTSPPMGLHTFERDRADFDYLPRRDVDAIHAAVKDLAKQFKAVVD